MSRVDIDEMDLVPESAGMLRTNGVASWHHLFMQHMMVADKEARRALIPCRTKRKPIRHKRRSKRWN